MKRVQGHGVLRNFVFEFYALLATQFSLRRRRIRQRQGRRYVRVVLRRLRRYLFSYLRSKFSTSCFNAIRRTLFALSVFYAI